MRSGVFWCCFLASFLQLGEVFWRAGGTGYFTETLGVVLSEVRTASAAVVLRVRERARARARHYACTNAPLCFICSENALLKRVQHTIVRCLKAFMNNKVRTYVWCRLVSCKTSLPCLLLCSVLVRLMQLGLSPACYPLAHVTQLQSSKYILLRIVYFCDQLSLTPL